MSLREIGSEFWDVPVANIKNAVFPSNINWYLSGRSALSAVISDIIREKKIYEVMLPSWCCDSMITPFTAVGVKVVFYSVVFNDGNVEIHYPDNIKADVILLMDYFGYAVNQKFPFCDCVKIRDVTHSVFTKNYDDADYCFGSLRKWAGFYTGGFAWKCDGKLLMTAESNDVYVGLRKQAMAMKGDYISGKSDSKEYLGVFADAEKLLDSPDVYGADAVDIARANYLDIDFIKKRRFANASILLSRLRKYAMWQSLNDGDCPLFVPIFVSNRDKVHAALVAERVYCPRHWGISEYHNILTEEEKQIYDNELSLVCDQRYSSEDMYKICDIVERTAVA